jgi:hypothetical protein
MCLASIFVNLVALNDIIRPMFEEKILTRHPRGKTGRNISKESYDAVKSAILSSLKAKDLTHTELFGEVRKKLKAFSGNVDWYAETVKLDLEARKIIQRTSSKPQKYRLLQG